MWQLYSVYCIIYSNIIIVVLHIVNILIKMTLKQTNKTIVNHVSVIPKVNDGSMEILKCAVCYYNTDLATTELHIR